MIRKTMILMGLGLFLLMTACGGGTGRKQVEWEDLLGQSERDTTIYGTCMNTPATNSLQLLTDNGDTLQLNIAKAKENERVFGGISMGDRIAVLVTPDSTEAIMLLNETTLMGEWVMPNPMDGSSEMGFFIKDGGIVESINMGTIVYESWRMFNGMLEIRNTRDDGGNFEELNRYQVLYLSKDSLVFKDHEDTYEYRRPHGEEDYSDLDIELDEGSFNDFVM